MSGQTHQSHPEMIYKPLMYVPFKIKFQISNLCRVKNSLGFSAHADPRYQMSNSLFPLSLRFHAESAPNDVAPQMANSIKFLAVECNCSADFLM